MGTLDNNTLYAKKAPTVFPRRIVLLLFTASILSINCYGQIVIEPNYAGCHCWEKDVALVGKTIAGCNVNGALVVWASSGVGGAATAEAQVQTEISVPGSGERRITVEVEIVRSGGADTYGPAALAGTDKTWAIGDANNYHRKSVDDWFNTEIAITKILEVLSFFLPTPTSVEAVLTIVDVAAFFGELYSNGDAEIIHIRFEHTVPDGTNLVPIWAGLRADAKGLLLGTGYGVSVGYVRKITVFEVDPPVPPIVYGGIVELGMETLVAVENPPNNADANCYVDWDDEGPSYEEFIGVIPEANYAIVYHEYPKPGRYTVSCYLERLDGQISPNGEVEVLVKPLPPDSVTASNGEFTDKVRISWTPTDPNDRYRVYRADSQEGEKIALGRWQSETFYDDHSGLPETAYSYWVQAGDGRCLYSGFSNQTRGSRLAIDYDLNDDGNLDYHDVALLADYWLVSGVGMAEEIVSDDETVNLHHFAFYAAQRSGSTSPQDDIEPPSKPQNLQRIRVTDTSAEICWDPSTDNIGVAGYNIYRYDRYGSHTTEKIDTVSSSSYTDTDLEPGFSASYKVSAFDRGGNHSRRSDEEVHVHTDAGANLIDNGSFETDPSGYWAGFSTTASWDTATTPHYGEGSFQVYADTYGLACQTVRPLAKTQYILSGWIKTQEITRVGLWVTYDEYDSINEWSTIGKTLPMVGDTTEWTYYETRFRTSRDFEDARVSCRWNTIDGIGWFDDIKLVPAE